LQAGLTTSQKKKTVTTRIMAIHRGRKEEKKKESMPWPVNHPSGGKKGGEPFGTRCGEGKRN